jgi:AcrR family transcriptional regulator
MGRALFAQADFLKAARDLAARHGPSNVTIEAITERLNVPRGSPYHRFASRDLLLGELWLSTVLDFQKGFVAAVDAGNWLEAALHTPVWVRQHLNEARLLLLHNKDDFVQGEWPASLKRGVADQARRYRDCIERFARDRLGGTGSEELRIARFVLADLPGAAVRPHLDRREPPPAIVDELIRRTYSAIVDSAIHAVDVVRRPTKGRAQ